jgi:hypothetical protein
LAQASAVFSDCHNWHDDDLAGSHGLDAKALTDGLDVMFSVTGCAVV